MTFKQTFEKITESKIFQNFKKENPEAKLIAGFFIIDFLGNDNKKSLDYKAGKDIFTFSLTEKGDVILRKDKLIENSNQPLLEEIKPEVNIELDELKDIIDKEKRKLKVSQKINKIIAVLQTYSNTQIWNLTCMLDDLIILQIILDSKNGEILKSEKKNMIDFIKK